MISTNLIKKLGMLGVSMGLFISPLALSDEVILPAVVVIGEDLISPSFRSNPVNDPRYITQAAFRGPVTASGLATADLSPSFWSNPINDPFMNGYDY